MGRINILPPDEARKIAAGEVVERPASVIKELLENALDAQATEINIAVHDGGKKRMSITDNGCGMSVEDIFLSIEHHATSKIRSVDELSHIDTFGFRGEALSSISSVSMMRVTTRRAEDECGFEILVQQGTSDAGRALSAPVGTTIIVEDLFFNVPARRKFLKQRDTEWRAIQQLVTAYALAFPAIGFTLHHDDNVAFTVPPAKTLLERAQHLFPAEISAHLTSLEHTVGPIKISGVITNHQVARYDRKLLFSFVNQRWVKNHILGKSVLAGYGGMLPPNKYPVAVLRIEMPKDQVDINVHPRKEEVLLMHPHTLSAAIEKAVEQSLSKRVSQLISSAIVQPRPVAAFSAYVAPRTIEINTSISDVFEPIVLPKKNPNRDNHVPYVSPDGGADDFRFESVQHEQQKEIPREVLSEPAVMYDIIGQLRATYILLETAEGLMIIDQHAAHEAVVYNQLQESAGALLSTALLFPECIAYEQADREYVQEVLLFLRELGISAELWSDTHFMITASPVLLHNIPLADMINIILDGVRNMIMHDLAQHEAFKKKMYHTLYAMVACKKAVKAGDVLSHNEMKGLLDSFMKTSQKLHCPHGRPTSWLVSVHDLETWFQRK